VFQYLIQVRKHIDDDIEKEEAEDAGNEYENNRF
jgi:hypothetical protein